MNKNDFYDWVESAKGDITKYDLCLKRKDYHTAIYHLQQTLEKTAKASMMATSLSVPTQNPKPKILEALDLPVYHPKDYGHGWRKKFISQLGKINSNPNFTEIFDLYKSNGLKDTKSTILNAAEVKDLTNPTETEITQIIKNSDRVLSRNQSKKFNSQLDKALLEYRQDLDKVAKLTGSYMTVDDIMHLVKSYLKVTNVIVALMLLSILLDPFEQNRYPENLGNEKRFIPHFKQFKTILNCCIRILEREASFWLD